MTSLSGVSLSFTKSMSRVVTTPSSLPPRHPVSVTHTLLKPRVFCGGRWVRAGEVVEGDGSGVQSGMWAQWVCRRQVGGMILANQQEHLLWWGGVYRAGEATWAWVTTRTGLHRPWTARVTC